MDMSRLYTVHQRVKPTFTGDYTEGELESRFEPVARVDASYLDDVYRLCNESHSGFAGEEGNQAVQRLQPMRSLSVGDIVEKHFPHAFYMCDTFGWTHLPEGTI